MFTGIVETMGTVKAIESSGDNLVFFIESSISRDFKIDQSVSHNGACLTVEDVEWDTHRVTAVYETLQRSNLKYLKPGDKINLERSLRLEDRVDGHFVQGHVDTIAECTAIDTLEGSWYFHFSCELPDGVVLIDKGSICLNGVSLTLVEPERGKFSVAIIPYTFEHTNFGLLKPGDWVNVEFDILGKYFARYFEGYRNELEKRKSG